MRKIGTLETTSYGTCDVMLGRYQENGREAIALVGTGNGNFQGEPIATLSVNLGSANLADGEFLAKTYSENEGLAKDALKSPLFTDTGRRIPSGFVQLEVWTLNQEAK